jgi:hypothetical protein
MYVYVTRDSGKDTYYAVGFFAPSTAEFVVESFHPSAKDASARVNYLNGGTGAAVA